MTDLLNLGKLPIPGDKPSGTDIRHEEIYDLLISEIDKRTALSGDQAVDWSKVVNLSYDILLNKSKDLLVCSYLCIGLLYTQNLKGFIHGVKIYSDLLNNYWDDLYPIRINGKINAINWWIDSANEKLQKIKPEIFSITEKDELEKNFAQIVEFLSNKKVMELDAINSLIHKSSQLVLTSNITENILVRNQSENLDHKTEFLNNPHKLDTALSHPDQQSLEILTDTNMNLDKILLALSKVSDSLFDEQNLSYQTFKINRFVAWLDVIEKPVYDNESKTMLPPPDESLQQAINRSYQDKNWLELIQTVEAQVINFRFWLDLSFYAYTALKNMNQNIQANEVQYATIAFVKRLNGIENLLFSDGMQFANDETRDWINSFDNTKSNDNIYTKSDVNTDLITEITDANNLVQENKVEEAISQLHHKIKSSITIKERFLRMIQFCQFVVKIGHGQLSKAYINELISLIQEYKLENWDPELVSNAYITILNINKQEKSVKLDEQLVNEVLLRLSLINPLLVQQFY